MFLKLKACLKKVGVVFSFKDCKMLGEIRVEGCLLGVVVRVYW